jgi:hypothetical protein
MAEPSSAAPKSAAPRRGKFLAGPAQLPSEGSSSSSSSSPGGSHLSSSAGTANAGGTADGYDGIFHDHSIEDLKAHVHNIKTMATVRRKAIESQRKSVLDDLDKAEDVVLALLELASGVTSALSDMTTATSSSTTTTTTTTTRQSGSSELTNNVEEGGEGDNNNARQQLGGKSFEELATRVSSGSAGYSTGVKKLHTLLAPHAHYVKSLTNSNKLTSTNGTDNGGERSTTFNNYGSLMTAATSSSIVSNSKDGNDFGKIIKEATSNMYAVRVKKRLVMERCEVLRQMIQLEEEDDDVTLSEETGQVKVEEEQDDKPKKKVSAAASSKRKRR